MASACCIDIAHWDLGLWPAHGSGPLTFGKGALLGALDIDRFLDVGAAFIGMLGAGLDDVD